MYDVLSRMQMPKGFFVAIAVILAVFFVPLRASEPVCGMSMRTVQKADCMACCAAMKSCALPKQNPTHPSAASAVDTQAVAMIAPAISVLLSELPAAPIAAPRLITQSLAHSPPRLALFCSFLI